MIHPPLVGYFQRRSGFPDVPEYPIPGRFIYFISQPMEPDQKFSLIPRPTTAGEKRRETTPADNKELLLGFKRLDRITQLSRPDDSSQRSAAGG